MAACDPAVRIIKFYLNPKKQDMIGHSRSGGRVKQTWELCQREVTSDLLAVVDQL